MDLKRMSLAVSSTSKEQDCYVKYCRDLGLDPEWINKVFEHKLSKARFRLIGLKKQGRLFTVWVMPISNSNTYPTIYATSYSINQFITNCIPIEEN